MAPTNHTKKEPAAHSFWSHFPENFWSGNTPVDLDYRLSQDDDSESSSDKCSIMSGDDQVVAEGCARDATSETASSGAEGAPDDKDSEEDKSSDTDNEKYVCSLDAYILVN
jgi:hypothetical protein